MRSKGRLESIITTLLFAFIHGITFGNHLSVIIDPGFVLGWIRANSGSILPAIVLHNGINLLATVVPWLL
ncbi:CPBP family intramembrane glutamic endopeptidase [Gracilibacillus saliphilus]|uniref:CPBP family intramembrane glutamic endopeptidase n=1 Tax=Gracilibacillus saliphilus TaxID=543890 RepID=UPI00235687C1|nr:CPBP family intramembrane glutamic endopeptidase [Gracilibacillus saliphilus]